MALTLANWQHDSEVLKDAVLDEVHKRLMDNEHDWDAFLRETNQVLNAAESNETLKVNDPNSSIKSFRAILESLDSVFTELPSVEKWDDAEFYVLRQIELIENVLRF
jgi:hypothetical protein